MKRDVKTPMGTIALLVLFAILIVGAWVNAYTEMLSRGVTQ